MTQDNRFSPGDKQPERYASAAYDQEERSQIAEYPSVYADDPESMLTPEEKQRLFRHTVFFYRFSIFRLALTAVMTVLLFLLDNLPLFGVSVGNIFNLARVDASAALIDLELVFVCAIWLPWGKIYNEVRNLHILPETIGAVGVVFTVAYDLALWFGKAESPLLLGFLPALYLCALALSEFFTLKNQKACLSVYMMKDPMMAAIVSRTMEIYLGPSGEEQQRQVSTSMKVRPVRSVNGILPRLRKSCETYRENAIMLISGTVLGGLAFLWALLAHDGGFRALAAWITLFFMAQPFAVILGHKAFFAALTGRVRSEHGAIADEAAAYEYTDTSLLKVRDEEAFSGEQTSLRQIKLFGECKLDDLMYYMSSLFSMVGGPLHEVMGATTDRPTSNSVTIREVNGDGISCLIDGRSIIIGNTDFLKRYGMPVTVVDEDDFRINNSKVSVLYVAIGTVLSAKFYIRYAVDEDFERRVERLAKLGLRTEIGTFDPGINNALLDKLTYIADCGVTIRRLGSEDLEREGIQHANSGLFSPAAMSARVLSWVADCRRYVRLKAVLTRLKLFAAPLGALVYAVAAGASGARAGLSLFPGLYLLALTGIFGAGVLVFWKTLHKNKEFVKE